VTEPLLDRATLRDALGRLAGRLHARGIVGDVYLFGGGAMVLAFDTRPATRDLDGRFAPDGPIQAEALEVARELALPGSWLNQQGVFYLPRHDEPDPTPGVRPSEPTGRAGIRSASAGDEGDGSSSVRRHGRSGFLVGRPGLDTVEEVEAVCAQVFPEQPFGDRQREVIADVIAGRR